MEQEGIGHKIRRRDILKAGVWIAAGVAIGKCLPGPDRSEHASHAQQGQATHSAYMPQISKEPTPTPANAPWTGSKVIHVHDAQATYWDYGSNYYGNYVNQAVVNEMVDRGVRELTDAATVAEAWRAIIPDYVPGKAIAIKVNFNNCTSCSICESGCEDWQLKIDALVHPINALIRGLELAYPSLSYSDIWVYDATTGMGGREIPSRFVDSCQYIGVRYFDRSCHNPVRYNSTSPTAYVTWRNPSGIPNLPSTKVADVLVNATYLINMPIMKKHGGAGVSLAFKNHFGSIDNCEPLHDWVSANWGQYYSAAYSPLVDVYLNPHIAGKTRLTIGDGLFGDRISNYDRPTPWETFGHAAPNSLFFSTDPVAIDSIMCDFLHIEGYQSGIVGMSDDYLKLAEVEGLGVYERGDPWGSGYERIEYNRFEL